MIRLYRDNAWTRIEGITPALRERLHWYLAVHLQTDQPSKGVRFGRIWTYAQKWYGSMLHDADGSTPDRVPAGLTRHVVWIAQEQGLSVELRDMRVRPAESYPWHTMRTLEWRPYQDAAHAAIMQHGTGVIVAPPRCLAGDAIIGVQHAGVFYNVRLQDLVDHVLGPCPLKQAALARVNAGEDIDAVARSTGYRAGQLRCWGEQKIFDQRPWRQQSDTPMLVRYRDAEGHVRLAPLLGAVRAGVKPLYRVTLASGKTVRASLDHKFLTSAGWCELRNLQEGSLVWEQAARHKREYKTQLSAVMSIESTGEGDTYDLCMPDPHNFIANGIVVSNSGKTAIAARAIDTLGLPTLYIAPSVPIVRQTYETFCRMFGENMVARLDSQATDDQRKINKPIVVSTSASAVRQSAEWWRTRQVLILDEVHHSASNSWHEINQSASHIYHRLGFTGTYFRTGGDDLAMHAVTGDVLLHLTVADLVAQGYLAKPKVFFLSYKAPRVHEGAWHDMYTRGIVNMEARNQLVAHTANVLMSQGERIIVLTRRRAHADLLGSMLQNSVVVKGGEGALTSGAVRDFLRGRYQVLVGTTVIGEGVDVPAASALIYASGGSDGVQLIQSYFRPMTRHAGKPIGRIYDFVDKQHRLFEKHSKERMDAAREHLGNENVFTH